MSERLLIVADTGPLISLARIGQVEVLRHLYDEVCIPPARIAAALGKRLEVRFASIRS